MSNIENSVICVILNEFYCICVLQVPSALAADQEKTWSLCLCAAICSFQYSCLLTHLFVLACTCFFFFLGPVSLRSGCIAALGLLCRCTYLLNYVFKNVHVSNLNYDQSPQWAVWPSVLLPFHSGFLDDFALLCALIIHVVIP